MSLASLSLLASLVIWIASSLVGVNIRAWISFDSRFIFSKSGSKKASVLPVPVAASAITSFPYFIRDILCSWIGVGVVIPVVFNIFIKSSLSPNCLKFILFIPSLIS